MYNKYLREKNLQIEDVETLQSYETARNAGLSPSIAVLLATVKACGRRKELHSALKIHAELTEHNHDRNIFVANALVDMYARCGSLADAHRVFDRIEHPTVVSWNTIIRGYARSGEADVALDLFAAMQSEGFQPDARTYVAVINACTGLAAKESFRELDGKMVKVTSLETGMTVHSQAARNGVEVNAFLVSSLLDMYLKCGSMEDATRVFDKSQRHSLVSWNVMILGHAENGNGSLALELFTQLQRTTLQADERSFVAAILSCTALGAQEVKRVIGSEPVKVESLEKGLAVHSQLRNTGHESSLFVASALVDMYTHCGCMVDARRVFDRMTNRDIVLWTAIIMGYAENEKGEVALALFVEMVNGGLRPDERTYVAALKACSCFLTTLDRQRTQEESVIHRWLETAMAIHVLVVEDGLERNMYVANTLVDVYAKLGSMEDARRVFDGIQHQTVVSWTAIIWGYVEADESELALKLFEHMQAEGVRPDSQAFLPALMACSRLAGKKRRGAVVEETLDLLEKGMSLHSWLLKLGHPINVFVASSLVDMYAKSGSIADAERVFNRVAEQSSVSWNAMVTAYVECDQGKMALELFSTMQDCGFQPDARTYIAVLGACASLAANEKVDRIKWLDKGMELHSQADKLGLSRDGFVSNTLIDMYAKCGCMADGRRVFDRVEHPSLVSWNAIITGYEDNGESASALELYERMHEEGFTPNALTVVPALKACGSLARLETGKDIHSMICREGLMETCEQLTISLVNFYAKCGRMVNADQVSVSVEKRDVNLWNSLLAGCSQRGDTDQLFKAFERMREEGARPDGITFLTILSACSHAGLVKEGESYFELMAGAVHGLVPGVEHFNCLVDMLGRANQLQDAVRIVKDMPCEADLMVWKTLLSASIKWKDVEVGRLAFESIRGLDVDDSASYVLMSNLHKMD